MIDEYRKIASDLYDNKRISFNTYLEALEIELFPKEITDKLFLKPSAEWLLKYKVQLEFEGEDER